MKFDAKPIQAVSFMLGNGRYHLIQEMLENPSRVSVQVVTDTEYQIHVNGSAAFFNPSAPVDSGLNYLKEALEKSGITTSLQGANKACLSMGLAFASAKDMIRTVQPGIDERIKQEKGQASNPAEIELAKRTLELSSRLEIIMKGLGVALYATHPQIYKNTTGVELPDVSTEQGQDALRFFLARAMVLFEKTNAKVSLNTPPDRTGRS